MAATKLPSCPESSISFLSWQREGFSPRGTGAQTAPRPQRVGRLPGEKIHRSSATDDKIVSSWRSRPDRPVQQITNPNRQDFGKLVFYVYWLNQLDDVTFGHGISLLSMEKWRRRVPPRYAAFPIPAVVNFGRSLRRKA